MHGDPSHMTVGPANKEPNSCCVPNTLFIYRLYASNLQYYEIASRSNTMPRVTLADQSRARTWGR